jgi:hypothetical protein
MERRAEAALVSMVATSYRPRQGSPRPPIVGRVIKLGRVALLIAEGAATAGQRRGQRSEVRLEAVDTNSRSRDPR